MATLSSLLLKKNKFFHNKNILYSQGLLQSFISIIGDLSSASFSALALILISRRLGPASFGEFSAAFAIVLIVSRINDAGLSPAILKYAGETSNQKIKDAVFSITTNIKLIFSLIILIINFLIYPVLAEKINLPKELVFSAISLGVITVYYEQLQSTLLSIRKITHAVVMNFLQSLAKLATASIYFFFLPMSLNTLFSIYILAPFFGILGGLYFFKKSGMSYIKETNWNILTKIFSLAKHSAMGFIAIGLIDNIDILLVQKYLSSFETGLFSGVSKIALLFSLIAYSLGNVLNTRVARYKKSEDIYSYILKSWLLIGLTFICLLIVLLLSERLLILLLGINYVPGLAILNILLIASFVTIACVPFIALFYTLDALWYFSVSGILQLVIVILGNLIFVPLYGLEAAALTRLISKVFLLIFTIICAIYLVKRHLNQDQKRR